MTLTRLTLCTAAVLLASACATPPPQTVSVAEVVSHPAERALVDGLRDYENGAFEPAAKDFHAALDRGLRDPRDTAVAYKHLAFIDCAFNRLADCERNFRSAFAADPGFHLSESEIGHPIWGPVYRRVAAENAAGKGKPGT